MNQPNWIETSGLTKRFGTHQALDGLSLCVARGEVYGFLGPNGAGKTTCMRILMGMLVPDSGVAKIRGLDCIQERVEVKRVVGYLPDVPVFYDYLKGRELLRFVGQMHGLKSSHFKRRAEQLMSALELDDAAGDYVSNYSLGMKKKMALVLALLHEPEVLVLDEPTTGLDPKATRLMQRLIRDHAAAGGSVLLSTHLLDMAERLCDRVGILHRGQLVAEGQPRQLRERMAQSSASSEPTLEEVFFALTAEQE
jgi:ABC-2 type transport system ATP-binding protein